MENCTIYSHHLNFEKIVEIVKVALPKASIDFNDGEMQKSLIATIKGGFFGKTKTLKINYRQRQNPSYKLESVECGLTQNLVGMVNYIQAFPAENENLKNKFLHKVMASNCEMAFIIEPVFNDEFRSVLQNICIELDAFIFTQPNQISSKSDQQHFIDKNFNLIIDPLGRSEIQDIEVNVDAKYHDQPATEIAEDQIQRKSNSETFLEKHGIKVNKNLPVVESVNEVNIRNVKEVIDRAYGLLITAVKGEGIEQEHLERTIKDKAINSLSPKERMIFESSQLSDQERGYATWRYESLYVIMWVLGMEEELKFPNEICDVGAIVGKIFKPSRPDFEAAVSLRSPSEILDELDKIYRINWACVDARIKGQTVSGNVNPSIVYERHYALNWLTSYQNQDWDNVSTDT